MLKIDPDTLDSLNELEKLLGGIVALPTLLERLGLRDGRVFRDALWGWEILEAARRTKPFGEAGEPELAATARLIAPRVAGRERKRARKPNAAQRLSAKDLAP